MSKDTAGNYHQRLHALDVTTGAEITGSPKDITASYMSTSFAPGQYEERAALLLANGTVYTSWTSHCDEGALWRLGDRLQRKHARTNRRCSTSRWAPAAPVSKPGTCNLDERRRPGGGCCRQCVCADGQWSLRDHSGHQWFSQRRRLREFLRENFRPAAAAGSGRLLRADEWRDRICQ